MLKKNKYLDNVLTIAVCSNRLEKIREYILPSFKSFGPFYKLLIILDSNIEHIDFVFLQEISIYKNIEVITSTESGLSNLRNFILRYCTTKYILFIDDDVTLEYSAVRSIEEVLIGGIDIVGLPLKIPNDIYINHWYITENQYHYLGIHAKSNITSIWGACMAFNIETIKRNNIFFRGNLDRQKGVLLSGGDTTFINELKAIGALSSLLVNTPILHHIEKKRLTLIIFTKRVYWQGITESVRYNIRKGLVKEFRRNFSIITCRSILAGVFCFFVFLIGIVAGLFYRSFYTTNHMNNINYEK